MKYLSIHNAVNIIIRSCMPLGKVTNTIRAQLPTCKMEIIIVSTSLGIYKDRCDNSYKAFISVVQRMLTIVINRNVILKSISEIKLHDWITKLTPLNFTQKKKYN